jgi:hypothetical protein
VIFAFRAKLRHLRSANQNQTDDKTTFQQKIDFANARGLNGLLIWSVDMDDSSFTALKAVSGKDLTPTIAQSDTLGQWSRNECWITPCGTGCQEGWTKMVRLRLDFRSKADKVVSDWSESGCEW